MSEEAGDGTQPLRFGLLGAFGVGNLGNDASLEAMANIARAVDPQAEVLCLCPQPDAIRAELGIVAAPFRARRPGRPLLLGFGRAFARVGDVVRAFRQVGRLDGLIVPGTGILDDYGGEKPSGWPYTLALWFGAARLRRVRTALVSVGAGPLESRTSRRLARLTGRLADHVTVRDQGSRNFMTSLGLRLPPAAVVPDVAFALPVPNARETREHRPVIAIPVMKYHGWHPSERTEAFGARQTDALGEFCCWLLDEGYAVRLITADAGDQPATDQVEQVVTAGRPHLARLWLSSHVAKTYAELTALLHDTAAVVATRYHSVIGALACGRPTLSLGYAAKNDHLMATVGLAEFCQRVDDIDQALLRSQFTTLMEQRERLEQQVAQRVAAFRAQLADEAERIRRLLQR